MNDRRRLITKRENVDSGMAEGEEPSAVRRQHQN